MLDHTGKHRHPFVSILMLLLLALAGGIVFTIIGLAIAAGIYGSAELFNVLSGDFAANIGLAKILQASSTIGIFIVPAILLAKFEGIPVTAYHKLTIRPAILLIVLCAAIVWVMQPFLVWMVELNQQMNLPAFLQDIEQWMKTKEEAAAEITKSFLAMKTPADLAGALLLIAVLPAIGEELLFRGCLQQLFTRWTGNVHWGIWIAALIFSAIHLQFYGFVPRALLGALFGYLFVWSNTLWIPVLAHFFNNAAAVITAYSYQRKGIPLDDLEKAGQTTWPYVILSFSVGVTLLWLFHNRAQKDIKTANGAGLG